MRKFHLLNICLSLFDGDGGAGAPAGEGATADGGEKAGSQAIPGRSRRGNSGGMAGVLYGKQADGSPVAGGKDSGGEGQKPDAKQEDRRKAFLELVNGDYKDLYTEETQRIIDRRFRETKGLEETVEGHKPILDMLAQRYHVADGDPAKLLEALEADDAYWSEAADDAGMTVEQYKEFQRLQRESEEFHKLKQRKEHEEAAQQTYAAWMQEAEGVKAVYPQFDMSTEVQNPEFMSMLRSGVPLRHAYEVAHLDTIKGGIAQQTAAKTERAVMENIRAKGNRPAENGVGSGSGITVKNDVSKLSRQDRQEIARRVARGENIMF